MLKLNLSEMPIEELEKLHKAIGDELAGRKNMGGLNPGDRVIHRHKYFDGEGRVVKVAKSGLRVRVEYKYRGWDGRLHDSDSYFGIDRLQKVN